MLLLSELLSIINPVGLLLNICFSFLIFSLINSSISSSVFLFDSCCSITALFCLKTSSMSSSKSSIIKGFLDFLLSKVFSEKTFSSISGNS